jgi:type II secretory pathway pseudopilin PulG
MEVQMENYVENKGITLIALIITIIIMLILAGVSLNAILGDNGIIEKAQEAKVSQAVASLSEYMQTYVFDKQADDLSYNIEDLYVSSGWLERKIEVDEEGNAYYIYLINKSKIEDGDLLAQINNGSGDPYTLKDVYGVNPDFTVWYKDGLGNLVNSEIQVVAIDNNTEANFSDPALSTAISNAVGVDEEKVTIGQLKNITTLKLNYDGTSSDIKNLDDLYYLPNLRYLYIYNLNLNNIEGLKYTSNLCGFYSYYNTIVNFDGLQYSFNLKSLIFSGKNNNDDVVSTINDSNVTEMFSKISNLPNITSLTINNMSNLSNIEKLNVGLQNLSSKFNIISLCLETNSNLNGQLNLNGMNNLRSLFCDGCQITKILGLENMELQYFNIASNNLQDIGNLVIGYEKYSNTTVNLSNNSNIKTSSITDISEYLLNASSYIIDIKYVQYIEGNTTLDYTSVPEKDVVDGYITEVADSVTTVNLNGRSRLTNIDFLKDKINITTLNLNYCTGITQESFTNTLSTLTGLTNLYMSSCTKLTDISFINNMPNLKNLYINNTSVKVDSINNINAVALNSLSLNQLLIGNNGTDNNINLTYIQSCISKITGSGLQFQGSEEAAQSFINQLENCTQITQLTMKYGSLSKISSINLSKCIELKELHLDYLNLDSLDISGCSKLEIIELTRMNKEISHFSVPDFSNCSNLIKLILNGNLMTSTEFNTMCTQLQNKTNFTYLDVNNNSILDISNINLLSNLTNLSMNNNNISDISSISSMSNLRTLSLQNNNLDDKAVSIIATLRQTYKKLNFSGVYLGGNPNITDITPLTELGFNATNLLAN